MIFLQIRKVMNLEPVGCSIDEQQKSFEKLEEHEPEGAENPQNTYFFIA